MMQAALHFLLLAVFSGVQCLSYPPDDCRWYITWSDWSQCDAFGIQSRTAPCPESDASSRCTLTEQRSCTETCTYNGLCGLPRTELACEGDIVRMACPGDQKINNINANYGRTRPDSVVCPFGKTHKDDTNCISTGSKKTVEGLCQDEGSCSVNVTRSLFGPDPCPGTYKYLQVEYQCCDEGPVFNINNKLRVSHVTDVTAWIADLAVAGSSILALKRVGKDPYTTQVVELDPRDGQELRVLHHLGERGNPRGLTSTRAGELYISTEEHLLRVSADGSQSVVRDGWYYRCRVDPRDGSTVYAVRGMRGDAPVLVDVAVNGSVVASITTHVTSGGYAMTIGVTHEPDVLFLCSAGQHKIYKISLADGAVLGTYGQYGNRRGSLNGSGDLNYPRISMTVPDAHQIIIVDYLNDRLQVLNTSDGAFYVVKVTAEDPQQQLGRPWAVAVLDGRVYVRGWSGGIGKVYILETQD